MTEVSDKPTLRERYIAASGSSDMTVGETVCDADKMLAAGFASARDEGGSLALEFYRMRASGDMRGFGRLTGVAGNWIKGRTIRKGKDRIVGMAAKTLAEQVVKWWIVGPPCEICEGRGHPLIPLSSRCDDSRDCAGCNGTGKLPVEKSVRSGHGQEARWLADELDKMANRVFGEMARRLSTRLDL